MGPEKEQYLMKSLYAVSSIDQMITKITWFFFFLNNLGKVSTSYGSDEKEPEAL